MNLPTILRARACRYLGTSLVTMSNEEYQTFLINQVGFYYPKLESTLNELYLVLVGKNDLTEAPVGTDPYEWWLTRPVGPNSDQRDISDLRTMLRNWFISNPSYNGLDRISISLGDEWEKDLDEGLKYYQRQFPEFLVVTGYGDNETIRRLRMQA